MGTPFITGVPGLAPADAGEALRVLLIDGSRLISEGFRRRLLLEPDIAHAATATSAAEARRRLEDEPFDVVVASADLALELYAEPGGRVTWPIRAATIVLADAADEVHARDLFRSGVVGWVGRHRSISDLIAAIRMARHGHAHIDIDILALITHDEPRADPSPSARDRVLSRLTAREQQVFLLLEQGMGRADIAAALQLSPNTVRTHIQRILQRLNVHSSLAALAAARAEDVPIS